LVACKLFAYLGKDLGTERGVAEWIVRNGESNINREKLLAIMPEAGRAEVRVAPNAVQNIIVLDRPQELVLIPVDNEGDLGIDQ
jgi:hypothetical protein